LEKINKYSRTSHLGQQKVAYLPPSDTTKDKENKVEQQEQQKQQAQIQSKETQEKNGKVQNNEGKSKKVKKDFTPPENSNVIDLT